MDFVKREHIAKGVICDVYHFMSDASRDLAVIYIQNGYKTPKQMVLKGIRTIEGYHSGEGRLEITRLDGTAEIYDVGSNTSRDFAVEVNIGDIMQWIANDDSFLTVTEVCCPKFVDGRFLDLA